MLRSTRARVLIALAALVTTFAVATVDADARARSGGVGSRGSRTYTAPPATTTAPNTAAPINRSMTQSSTPSAAAKTGAAPQPGGFFSRGGLLGGLAAGFLGAGLLGMLMGHGFLGGLAGFASFLGLIFQIVVIGGIAYLLWNWWQRRSQPAPAMAGGPAMRGMSAPLERGALAGLGGSSAPVMQAQPSDEIGIGPQDYDTFERLLTEVQAAYAAEDLAALRMRVTPEILTYFSEEFAENASRGLVNQVSDVKLLQGDLAESWREGEVDYASVAMRYSMRDRLVERATNRVVEGSAETPTERTEVWTYRRARGGNWILSAIQEA